MLWNTLKFQYNLTSTSEKKCPLLTEQGSLKPVFGGCAQMEEMLFMNGGGKN